MSKKQKAMESLDKAAKSSASINYAVELAAREAGVLIIVGDPENCIRWPVVFMTPDGKRVLGQHHICKRGICGASLTN